MAAGPRLDLDRSHVLAFRQRAGALDERLKPGAGSLRKAAWAGLQDSMPRAALLSIHARVEACTPEAWEHPTLVQVWGPRYSVFVVARRDHAVFTRGTWPDDARGRLRAEDLAGRLHAMLQGGRMAYDAAGDALGIDGRSLKYAAPTGTVLVRWEGARRPVIWTVPAPDVEPRAARLELARRYLHVYGPTTSRAFARWAGLSPRSGAAAFASLGRELIEVGTPMGDAWILESDEADARAGRITVAPARLLPSGDAYFLLHGPDRHLLVPDRRQRDALWTARVWPGALVVGGELAGTWRRADRMLSVQPWRALSPSEREAVAMEVASMPLPGIEGKVTLRFGA